jgi:hypothetical protein
LGAMHASVCGRKRIVSPETLMEKPAGSRPGRL